MAHKHGCISVDCFNGRHVFFGKVEVEHVKVLRHPFRAGALGEAYNATLQLPTNHDLSCGLVIFFTDFF